MFRKMVVDLRQWQSVCLADLGSAKQEEKVVLQFKFTKFLEKYDMHNIYKHSDHNFNVQYYRQLYFIDRQSNKLKGHKRDRICILS